MQVLPIPAFKAAMQAMIPQARKVYEFIPEDKAVNEDELMRLIHATGHRMQRRSILGSINYLESASLIRKQEDGRYARTPVAALPPVATITLEDPAPPPATTVIEPPKHSLLQRVADVAHSLRVAADELEGIAIEVEDALNSDAGAQVQLVKLRDKIKSLLGESLSD